MFLHVKSKNCSFWKTFYLSLFKSLIKETHPKAFKPHPNVRRHVVNIFDNIQASFSLACQCFLIISFSHLIAFAFRSHLQCNKEEKVISGLSVTDEQCIHQNDTEENRSHERLKSHQQHCSRSVFCLLSLLSIIYHLSDTWQGASLGFFHCVYC